jgi:hypothetical protein
MTGRRSQAFDSLSTIIDLIQTYNNHFFDNKSQIEEHHFFFHLSQHVNGNRSTIVLSLKDCPSFLKDS